MIPKNKNGKTNTVKKQMMESTDFLKLAELIRNLQVNVFLHPKLARLKNLLTEFFEDEESITNSSKVLIFTQNRNSAAEIVRELTSVKGIRPSVFVGKSGGGFYRGKRNSNSNNFLSKWDQAKQLETLSKFKKNEYNALVSTCVGEEGLDIGEVDLVVCFDNGFSPIRLVQRMGRTGRKRDGKVYVLLMEGKEFFMFRAMLKKSKLLRDNLKLQSIATNKDQTTLDIAIKKKLTNYVFYKNSPRMLPDTVQPALKNLEMHSIEENEFNVGAEYQAEGDTEITQQSKPDEQMEIENTMDIDGEIENFEKENFFEDILTQLEEDADSEVKKPYGSKRISTDRSFEEGNFKYPYKKYKENQSKINSFQVI